MKLTKEMIDLIRYGLSEGMSIKAVCGKAGISVDTYYRWKRDNNEFRNMVDSTQYDVEAKALQSMQVHADRDWRVWAWILERRFPKEWNNKHELQVQTKISQTGSEVVTNMLQKIIGENLSDRSNDKDDVEF